MRGLAKNLSEAIPQEAFNTTWAYRKIGTVVRLPDRETLSEALRPLSKPEMRGIANVIWHLVTAGCPDVLLITKTHSEPRLRLRDRGPQELGTEV